MLKSSFIWEPGTNTLRPLLGEASQPRTVHVRGQGWRRHISEAQHCDLSIRVVGIPFTIESLGLLAKAGACCFPDDIARLRQFSHDQRAFGIHIRRDMMRGQMIRPGKLDPDVFRRAPNPDGSSIASATPGVPDTDVVALPDIGARSLEGHIFLAAKEIETAHWCR